MELWDHPTFGQLRVVDESGNPWYCGRDVAKALGYVHSANAVRKFCNHAEPLYCIKSVQKGVGKDIHHRSLMIREGDVYRLVFAANTEAADRFRDWMVDDVLPSIHQHGCYVTPQKMEEIAGDPDALLRLALQLKDEQEKRLMVDAELQAISRRPQ